MSATTVMKDAFEVSDVTGQNVRSIANVPPGTKVQEFIDRIVGLMGFPTHDSSKRALAYHARSDREGRHLVGSEDVADAIKPGDRIVLQPNVDAGMGLCKSTIAS